MADHESEPERFERQYEPGVKIYSAGEQAGALYLIREGRVQLSKRARGIDRVISVCGPGDVFGEEALKASACRSTSAVVVDELTVLQIPRDRFVALLRAQPDVAEHFVTQLVDRLRRAEEQLHNMMLADPCARVVNSLLCANEDSGSNELALSPVELSARTGLALSDVKSVVRQLNEGGYLSVAAQRIHVDNAAALRDLYSLLDLKEDVRYGLS